MFSTILFVISFNSKPKPRYTNTLNKNFDEKANPYLEFGQTSKMELFVEIVND